MKARVFPINDHVFSAAFALLADGLSHAAFAPARPAPIGATPARRSRSRSGFWDRLDRWAWDRVQQEREAYLAKAQNLADLEERMRRLDDCRGRFF
jgi:hypothetical protein